MPDARNHRGPHPDDTVLFASDAIAALRSAVYDLSWMMSKGYAHPSALKLVGDRYRLTERQRRAVMRSSCSDEALGSRCRKQIAPSDLRNAHIEIDGFNVLTTIEAALSGGVVLVGRDGCYRDMASMHGSYRKVEETRPAIELLGQMLAEFSVAECRWYLDRPVSNSGRLKTIIREIAGAYGWPFHVETVPDPDALLVDSNHIVVSADSMILDGCDRWLNLARMIVEAAGRHAWVVDLSDDTD